MQKSFGLLFLTLDVAAALALFRRRYHTRARPPRPRRRLRRAGPSHPQRHHVREIQARQKHHGRGHEHRGSEQPQEKRQEPEKGPLAKGEAEPGPARQRVSLGRGARGALCGRGGRRDGPVVEAGGARRRGRGEARRRGRRRTQRWGLREATVRLDDEEGGGKGSDRGLRE